MLLFKSFFKQIILIYSNIDGFVGVHQCTMMMDSLSDHSASFGNLRSLDYEYLLFVVAVTVTAATGFPDGGGGD
jgi:hypothetical protein